MDTGRLEAFSDGLLAIIITVMVLELDIPRGASWQALSDAAPALLTYVLSFVFVGIYWNNHHHFFHLVPRIRGVVLWANLHLMFWLSLIPFTTSWMDRSDVATVPVAVYGIDLLFCAVAWYVMQQAVFRAEGPGAVVRRAVGKDLKGRVSPVLYIAGIVLAWVAVWISLALYVVVALMWLVPDRRFERAVAAADETGGATAE